tara:strand:- start:5711 stop:6760 length:1050 start_codon:yes stop_codon:yes gene_type:complete
MSKSTNLPLDKFIELALYDKKNGYYMKKNPFGKKGDFITAPNITRLFSEIIAIWVITFWKSLGSPKKINLIELGAGNGEMMKIIIETLKNFPEYFNSFNFMIYEKSKFLINEQKTNLSPSKIVWIKDLKEVNSYPTLYLANEFFDAIPVKQYFRRKKEWFEKFVEFRKSSDAKFKYEKTNIKNIIKILKFDIAKNQNIIEYSPKTFKYLNCILKIINKNNGGLLIIDYGYLNPKMQETLQAVRSHKYSSVLKNIGDSDITYNINFNLFKNFIYQFKKLDSVMTNQKKFLTNMGILKRAEIISKNKPFSKKTDLFYRIKRLIDEKQMGKIFKVMLIKNKKNKFNIGFQID